MVKQAIQIYLRVKPFDSRLKSNNRGEYDIIAVDSESSQKISLQIPLEYENSNRRDHLNFKFRQIFDQMSSQDSVFDAVAKPVIDNFVNGYNGTIFAYGQTGSGKTFTITGGAEKYSDRGIIPRTLSYIFKFINDNKSRYSTLEISYLEIYNENGYDLLDTKHDTAQKLEDLNKVTLYEDQDSNMTLKNLSIHSATNEEEALNLLFIGDTNRMVAETPMNQASTRSHCIFTLHLTSRLAESNALIRSKLHLVDLAGSERVYKTGIDGTNLTEAKYINLSLHYLEQVIVALGEKKRSHIPYRNSMMTSVLRDSLGGNCMTSMIATISVDRNNIMESISTCRFSQRVALIKNEAILNEDIDPQILIKQLRNQIDELKAQIIMQENPSNTNGNGQLQTSRFDEELSEDNKRRCRNQTIEYLEDPNDEPPKDLYRDVRLLNIAFQTMKELYVKAKSKFKESTSKPLQFPTIVVPDNPIATKEVKQLRDIINQRDNEINILVSMLKKAKQEIAESNSTQSSKQSTFIKETNYHEPIHEEPRYVNSDAVEKRILGELSVGREEAFEQFKREHELHRHIQAQQNQLKLKYQEAKQLGNLMAEARKRTNEVKSEIGRIRIQNSIQEDPKHIRQSSLASISQEELSLREKLDQEKVQYKESFQQLKNLKTVIEHEQHLLETSKLRVAKDFEKWWSDKIEQLEQTKMQQIEGFDLRTNSRYPTINQTPISSYRTSSSSSKILPNQYDTPSNRSQASLSQIPLTGDSKVDADIQRFINARNKLKF